MSLPLTERTSPRQIASAAAASGRFHDVVIAASKVVHAAPLEEPDRAALKWARKLLDAAGRATMVLEMPSAQQLAAGGTLAAAIRRAARPEGGSPEDALRELLEGIDRCLKGDPDESVAQTMLELRRLFAAVAQLALQADVLAQGEPAAPGSWATSTTSSRS